MAAPTPSVLLTPPDGAVIDRSAGPILFAWTESTIPEPEPPPANPPTASATWAVVPPPPEADPPVASATWEVVPPAPGANPPEAFATWEEV